MLIRLETFRKCGGRSLPQRGPATNWKLCRDCPARLGNFCLHARPLCRDKAQESKVPIWPGPCSYMGMTDFAASAHPAVSGKHNMASDAFEALRTARLNGKPAEGQTLSFADLIDTLNPLQHIPIVADAYRNLTGDTISPAARVAGGVLYGGAIGLVLSVADAAVEAVSGKDVGGHLVAGLFGDDKSEVPPTSIAAAAPSAQTDTTGSIAPAAIHTAQAKTAATAEPEQAQATSSHKVTAVPPQGLPQMSPDTFNALLGSFTDPKAVKAANPAMATKVAEAETAAKSVAATTAKPAASPASPDLLGAMQANLDRLAALKRANPDLPVAAFAGGDTGGF